MRKSTVSKLIAILLSLLTVMAVVPAMTLSAAAFDYPTAVEKLDVAIDMEEDGDCILVNVDTAALDFDHYDYYLSLEEMDYSNVIWVAEANEDFYIGAESMYTGLITTDMILLTPEFDGVSYDMTTAEEDYLFATLYAAEKDAQYDPCFYGLTWESLYYVGAVPFEYPETIEKIDLETIWMTQPAGGTVMIITINLNNLDFTNYDYYYSAFGYNEFSVSTACMEMAGLVGADIGEMTVDVSDYLSVTPDTTLFAASAENNTENQLFALLLGVKKGAAGESDVYQICWNFEELNLPEAEPIERLTDAIWIGDSAEAGVAAIEFDTDKLDFDTYDYYYTVKQYTEWGVSSACMEMNNFIDADPQPVSLTDEQPVPASGSVTFALDAEEGNNLMVCLYGIKKGCDIDDADVYVVAWDYAEVTLPAVEPEKTEAELAAEFAVASGFMSADETGKEKGKLGDMLSRLWNVTDQEIDVTTTELLKFTGVEKDDPLYAMLLWAEEHKLYVPSSKPIDVNQNLTRIQFIFILNKLAGSPTAEGDVHFADTFGSAYYIKQLDWAVDAGIITENVDCGAKFNPHGTVSVEEAALWVYRMSENGLIP